jgi:hypothetical protein
MGTGDPFPGVKRVRGVTLTSHPILYQGEERVGAISPLPLGGSGTALYTSRVAHSDRSGRIGAPSFDT